MIKVTKPTTVYLVSQGSYSSERTVGIFSTEKKATDFMVIARSDRDLCYDDFNDIQEWVIDGLCKERLLFKATSDTFEGTRQYALSQKSRYVGVGLRPREQVMPVLRDPSLAAREVEHCVTGRGDDDHWQRFTAYADTAEGALQALRQLRSEYEAEKAGVA